MSDNILDLLYEIQACECDIQKLYECGDLEGVAEATQKLEDLTAKHIRLVLLETGSR